MLCISFFNNQWKTNEHDNVIPTVLHELQYEFLITTGYWYMYTSISPNVTRQTLDNKVISQCLRTSDPSSFSVMTLVTKTEHFKCVFLTRCPVFDVHLLRKSRRLPFEM